nr:hypothetical protein [Flavobacteriaceae bacterium]
GNGHSYTIMSYHNSIDDSSALMGATSLMMAWENIPEGMTSDTGDDPGIFANGLIYLGNLLHDDYLFKTSKSRQERIAILSATLERIWVRFYRYVLITEWEIEIQKAILKNEVLSGVDLSKMYYILLKKYYRDAKIKEEASYEWMTYRVPFYSFEHQFWPAAMAGAATIFNKLKAGDSSGLKIMDVLGTSNLDMTYTLFKDAGIDMTSEEPYEQVTQLMTYLMDLLEEEI